MAHSVSRQSVANRHELGVVVENLVVDLVGHHDEVVLLGEASQSRERLAAIHRTRRVVRIDDDECARLRRDQRRDGIHVRIERIEFPDRGSTPRGRR